MGFEAHPAADGAPEPTSAAGWTERAHQLAHHERNTSALQALRRALELDPDYRPAWLRQAVLLEDLERAEDALAMYNAMVARFPDFVPAWSNRAGLLLRLGDVEGARQSLQQALALDPHNEMLRANLDLLEEQIAEG